MQTNSPHPLAQPTARILDLTPTLSATSAILHDFPCTSPSALLRACTERSEVTSLPPLSFLLLADRLAELYEMVFPDHPEWLVEEVVDWESGGDVAAAVERFLGRVHTLFPVHDDIWDVDYAEESGEALEVIEWRLYEIPVIPMGYDEWYDGWDDLKEPAPYLLHMRYSRRDEDGLYLRDEFEDLYLDYLTPRYLEPHRLVKTLRGMALPEPLDALPDLIEMLDHCTGNSFLDIGEMAMGEGGGYPPWDQEDVVWLAEEWQKAQPILDRVHRLLDWQNNSPEEMGFKLTAVRDVLLDAYQQTLTCPA